MADPIRIANCSGFFGDRISAAREMVEDGPIDVLTGDWLAELTAKMRNPAMLHTSTWWTCPPSTAAAVRPLGRPTLAGALLSVNVPTPNCP